MKMILVDKEKLIRDALLRLVDWEALGIEISGVYANGIDAYEAILDQPPDIVLTDIKMPGLDGLGLIKKVAALQQPIEFILLSGYSDFEFARQAMAFGVRHYLLKPCNEQTIAQVVRQAQQECRLKQHHAALERETESRWPRDLFLRNILYELFNGAGTEEIAAGYQARIDFQTSGYTACCIDHIAADAAASLWNEQCTWRRAQGLTPYTGLYANDTMILFHENDHEPLPAPLQQQHFWRPVQTTFPNLHAFLEELRNYYQDVEAIRMFNMDGAITLHNHAAALQQLDIFFKEMCELGASAQAQKRLAQFLAQVQSLELAKSLYAYFLTKAAALPGVLGNDFDLLQAIRQGDSCTDAQTLCQTLFALSSKLCCPPQTEGQQKAFIRELLQYVDRNLSNPNLSLRWICENILFMNAGYVSKEFARETGTKFSQYLNCKRIEEAKRLFKDGEEKINAVAQRVGCGGNPQYFGQVFKKYAGMPPSEYLKTLKERS